MNPFSDHLNHKTLNTKFHIPYSGIEVATLSSNVTLSFQQHDAMVYEWQHEWQHDNEQDQLWLPPYWYERLLGWTPTINP